MACSEWETKIDPYIDAELGAAEAESFSEHLSSCAACASAALGRMKLKRSVQSAGHAHVPSVEFRARIRSQVRGRSAASSRNAWLAFGLATIMLVFFAVGTARFSVRRSQTRQVVAEITDIHTSNLAAANPVDVISSDRHTVKPWFQGKIPFAFNLPELTGTSFVLVGGRLVFLEREPAAMLVYKRGAHLISVFIAQERFPLDRLDSPFLPSSFHIESWREGQLRYCVISDADPPEIQPLVALLKSSGKE
ncbi:MAG TPA: zf-HC2 domain-containing protein [Terriglobales bacterium]|nr:zf-HC2 domain-containing protein [Terriglobales bacterium]